MKGGSTVIKTYEDLKQILMKLCKNERLKFIEKHLSNAGIAFVRYKDRVILNIDGSLNTEKQEGKA